MPNSQQSLPFLLPEPQPARRPALRPVRSRPSPAPRRARLWAALRLPNLPLEVFELPDAPAAVVVEEAGGVFVLAANAAAEQQGIGPGLSLSGARALVPELHTRLRDVDAERRLLQRLAAWSQQFTPQVVLEPPYNLLLEVRGSLKLFGGTGALQEQLRDRLAGLGYAAQVALAPTPRAALWLVRAGREACLEEMADLAGTLGALPLDVTEIEAKAQQRLAALGATRVRDLVRLPRGGLSRRYGPAILHCLDQALGRIPDLRPAWQAPRHFHARRELLYETTQLERIERLLGQLLELLAGTLQGQGCGVQRIAIRLQHREQPDTRLTLGLLRPCADVERLRAVLAARLERVQLSGPVRAVSVAAPEWLPLEVSAAALFAEPDRAGELRQLIEHLQARLGPDAVRGLALQADHRLEHESIWVTSGTPNTVPVPTGPRPLWRFAEPRPAPRPKGTVLFAERLRRAWWAGEPGQRDYRVVRRSDGPDVWVYCEHGRVYWHGLGA